MVVDTLGPVRRRTYGGCVTVHCQWKKDRQDADLWTATFAPAGPPAPAPAGPLAPAGPPAPAGGPAPARPLAPKAAPKAAPAGPLAPAAVAKKEKVEAAPKVAPAGYAPLAALFQIIKYIISRGPFGPRAQNLLALWITEKATRKPPCREHNPPAEAPAPAGAPAPAEAAAARSGRRRPMSAGRFGREKSYR